MLDNPDTKPEKKVTPAQPKPIPEVTDQETEDTNPPSQKQTKNVLLPIILGSACIILVLVALSLWNKVAARDEAVMNGENRLTQVQARMDPLQAQVEDAKANALSMQKQIDEAKSGAILLKTDLAKARATNTDLQSQLERVRVTSTGFQMQMEEAKVASIKHQGEVELAQTQTTLLQAQLTKAETDISKLQAEQVASLEQITELKTKLDTAVTDGTLTQAEADAVAKAAENGVIGGGRGGH